MGTENSNMKNNTRVGLAIMRCQPLHRGHTKIISRMIEDCSTVIIGLGSAQKSCEKHDPWTVEQRIDMLQTVYGSFDNKNEYIGSRIKIVPFADIDAVTPEQWTDYIFEKIKNLGLPGPTDYYTGSEADAQWYRHCFHNDNLDTWPKSHLSSFQPHMHGYYDNGKYRELHIFDRTTDCIAGTEIRQYLELRRWEWKDSVPRVLHNLIEYTYPDGLKSPESVLGGEQPDPIITTDVISKSRNEKCPFLDQGYSLRLLDDENMDPLRQCPVCDVSFYVVQSPDCKPIKPRNQDPICPFFDPETGNMLAPFSIDNKKGELLHCSACNAAYYRGEIPECKNITILQRVKNDIKKNN